MQLDFNLNQFERLPDSLRNGMSPSFTDLDSKSSTGLRVKGDPSPILPVEGIEEQPDRASPKQVMSHFMKKGALSRKRLSYSSGDGL